VIERVLGNAAKKCFVHGRIVVAPGCCHHTGDDRKSVANFRGHAVDPPERGKKPARVFGGDIDAGL
jgi:hypothetical protein